MITRASYQASFYYSSCQIVIASSPTGTGTVGTALFENISMNGSRTLFSALVENFQIRVSDSSLGILTNNE